MLYLVNCEIVKSFYMDDTKRIEMNHIVEAENEEDAKEKVQSHYAKKDVDYHVSHWVDFNYVNEIIT